MERLVRRRADARPAGPPSNPSPSPNPDPDPNPNPNPGRPSPNPNPSPSAHPNSNPNPHPNSNPNPNPNSNRNPNPQLQPDASHPLTLSLTRPVGSRLPRLRPHRRLPRLGGGHDAGRALRERARQLAHVLRTHACTTSLRNPPRHAAAQRVSRHAPHPAMHPRPCQVRWRLLRNQRLLGRRVRRRADAPVRRGLRLDGRDGG